MQILSYRKGDENPVEVIGERVFDVLYALSALDLYKWAIVFPKANFEIDLGNCSSKDFSALFVENAVRSNGSFYKKNNIPLDGTAKHPAGITFSALLKSGKKPPLAISFSMGIYSPLLINCCNVTFHKGSIAADFPYKSFFKVFVYCLRPQVASLTDDLLTGENERIFGKIRPGYMMYFNPADPQIEQELSGTAITHYRENDALFIEVGEIGDSGDANKNTATRLSIDFENAGISMASVLV
jgi:hypothetical protein